ncbi:hypothetical protein BGX28_005844 [Mortierella sp. GBA30]|nr:hypothetical protein BGX28_005844 [Mortierella sp. GBA30]
MFRSSIAKIRLQLAAVNQFLILLLSLIIMGTIGVNGKITFGKQDNVCILYTTLDNRVAVYNNGYCLFPIVGATITFIASIVFLGYFILLFRRDEIFAPRLISLSHAVACIVMALFTFAICGEIGIGLKQGCSSLVPGWDLDKCRQIKNFEALYTAQVCAGIMGGAWMAAVILEYFQFKARPQQINSVAVEPAANIADKSPV